MLARVLLEVITESHEWQSRAVRTNIRTKPLCTSILNIISHPELATIPLPQRSTFDMYRFMLSDSSIPVPRT